MRIKQSMLRPRSTLNMAFTSICCPPLCAQVYLGCMIPNLLGTEFRQLDHRIDPRDAAVMEESKDKGKNELGAVVYQLNVMGRRAQTAFWWPQAATCACIC